MTDETSSATDLPSSVGRYQITGALGFGAMGAVYKAFDPLIKRTLAIKTIRLDIPRQSKQYTSFLERFYREARISGTLSHPNIVTLFDIGEEGGLPFLAMEFVDGSTIASRARGGDPLQAREGDRPRQPGRGRARLRALARRRAPRHQALEPDRVRGRQGQGHRLRHRQALRLRDHPRRRQLLGTPSYMSPEQAMGEKLDGRSDIFSLGVCAFEMLSGLQPFPGANVTAILYKLVHVDPIEPPDLELNGLVPQKWHDVFHKVLAKKPEDRYQTASAFVQDLEYCLGAWFTGLGQETVAFRDAPCWRRRRPPRSGARPARADARRCRSAVPQPGLAPARRRERRPRRAAKPRRRRRAAVPRQACATVMLRPTPSAPASAAEERGRATVCFEGGPASRRGAAVPQPDAEDAATVVLGPEPSAVAARPHAPAARPGAGCGAGGRGDAAAGLAGDRRRQPGSSGAADDARLGPALGAHGCRPRHRGWPLPSPAGSAGNRVASRLRRRRRHLPRRRRVPPPPVTTTLASAVAASGFAPRREQPRGRARPRERGAARHDTARPRRARRSGRTRCGSSRTGSIRRPGRSC